MIQRIQSVLLLLAAVLNVSVYFNALFQHATNDPQAWVGWGFALMLGLSTLGALGCIFLYRDRPGQVRWIGRSLVVQVTTLGYALGILVSLGGFGPFLWDEAVGVLIVALALAAQLYARKKVRDDEELVRSMDRIR
ncbi:MAG: DUF4293 family protein [Balneolaceae bacterium]|nr:DUF4293 family protein [Balneolaceae bacterium]